MWTVSMGVHDSLCVLYVRTSIHAYIIYMCVCVLLCTVCAYILWAYIAVLTSLQFDASSCTALAKPKMDCWNLSWSNVLILIQESSSVVMICVQAKDFYMCYTCNVEMWGVRNKGGKKYKPTLETFPTPPYLRHKTCLAIRVLLYVSHLAESICRIPTLWISISASASQPVLCAIIINGAIKWPHPTWEENRSCCRMYIHRSNQPDTGNTPWPQPEQLGM